MIIRAQEKRRAPFRKKARAVPAANAFYSPIFKSALPVRQGALNWFYAMGNLYNITFVEISRFNKRLSLLNSLKLI